jgi:hypothetical protein
MINLSNIPHKLIFFLLYSVQEFNVTLVPEEGATETHLNDPETQLLIYEDRIVDLTGKLDKSQQERYCFNLK